ncbi:hypothetical protein HCN51_51445 [Nonomuraea sp. FMUSA5-5]|uniref:RNA polymerase sigma-70 region 2 domain-containing protein n=1 Tax=Nonomuraea composti TaxID=2720023 RepID=A0ABX1BR87_9ACTN|nr:hypothetical protein [Nonomuraea sp. FMUSA5-5]NJP97746.1 hypothetical protein [Nonomuraea sp. FMUSA5-5]
MSDQNGFTGLFEEGYEAVLRYAWRRVGAADAPDIAAETFRIAWEKYDRVPQPSLTLALHHGPPRGREPHQERHTA